MIRFIVIVFFFIFFLIIIRLVRLISGFRSSSRKTIFDLNQEEQNRSKRFSDVEEADFKEIPTDKKNDD